MFDLGMPCRRPARSWGHCRGLDRIQPSETNSQRLGRNLAKETSEVIAPEAANNAKEGGALIPTLLLGYPDRATRSIAWRLRPHRDRARAGYGNDVNLDLTYLMIWSLALANILGAGICMLFAHTSQSYNAGSLLYFGTGYDLLIFFATFNVNRIGLTLLGCSHLD